jgi:hypothetical protein
VLAGWAGSWASITVAESEHIARLNFRRRRRWVNIGMCFLIIGLSFALVTLQDTLAEGAAKALGLKADNNRLPGVTVLRQRLWLGLLTGRKF